MASMTDVLSSIPGYGAYIARRNQNEQAGTDDLKQAATLQSILASVQQQRQGQEDRQRADAMQAEIAALPPEQRTRENVLPIIMKHSRKVSEITAALPEAPKPERPSPIGAGGLRLPSGEIVPPAPRPATPAEPKPPATRQRYDGTNVIQEEFVDGTWRPYGQGSRFGPQATALAKPPPGFRWKADGSGDLEAIPGGPKDTAPKDAARAQGAIQKADIVVKKVEEALDQTGFFSTGLTGKVLGMIPGTGAYDLDRTIDTIKAQIGFSELQAMREASPTGGALGQVAILELQMLQSTIASLEHGQSEPQIRRALQQVKKHFENWKNAVQQAAAGPQAAPAAPGGVPAAAAPSAAPTASGGPVDGQTATNKATGQKIIFRGGQWQPM